MIVLHTTVQAVNLVTQVPNPGTGTAPPGSAKITTLLQWAAWVVLAICVLGVFLVGARMAIAHQQGRHGEHLSGLAMVLGACVLVGSASALVGALV